MSAWIKPQRQHFTLCSKADALFKTPLGYLLLLSIHGLLIHAKGTITLNDDTRKSQRI